MQDKSVTYVYNDETLGYLTVSGIRGRKSASVAPSTIYGTQLEFDGKPSMGITHNLSCFIPGWLNLDPSSTEYSKDLTSKPDGTPNNGRMCTGFEWSEAPPFEGQDYTFSAKMWGGVKNNTYWYDSRSCLRKNYCRVGGGQWKWACGGNVGSSEFNLCLAKSCANTSGTNDCATTTTTTTAT